MEQSHFSRAYTGRVLSVLTLALLSGVSQAALVTLTFEGSLDTVMATSTVTAGNPVPAFTSGPADYSGSIEYDSDSGGIVSGSLTFASGYAINNHHPFIPEVAWTERSWGAVTYELAGTMVTAGDAVSLVIGNALDPDEDNVHDAKVLDMASSSVAPAIAGGIPTCIAFDPARQNTNCTYAPGGEILGLDSLSLVFSMLTNTHELDMDEVIEHCGGDCSTEWWHMSGGGTITSVPVPPALWLFGSALLVMFRGKLGVRPQS